MNAPQKIYNYDNVKLNLGSSDRTIKGFLNLDILPAPGVDILLESAKYFDNSHLFLLVGGDEKDMNEIRKKCDLKNIMLVPHKSHKEIPYYLKSADVLVLPNKKGDEISEKYTSPMKLFEYMASQRPIIASDLPSIREILSEDNAILISSNNAEKMSEGIKEVLKNKKLRDKISGQAYIDAQEYIWKRRAENIINFLEAH